MLLNWKSVESLERPLEIDAIMTTEGVYLRKDIQENDGKFTYKEVLLSPQIFRTPSAQRR